MAVVHGVKVTDGGSTCRTLITVIEGKPAPVAEANSLPPQVRDALTGWLGTDASNSEPWRGEHGGSSHMESTVDAPAVEARVGFTA